MLIENQSKIVKRFTAALPTPNFLTLAEVLLLHENQVEQFGGSFGVRDLGLLESALAQPAASFGGEYLHPTIADQAAAYLYHIAKNHPFIDGNKRTAFAVMDAFLRFNGHSLPITNEETYGLVIQVAQSDIAKAELTAKLKGTIVPKNAL
jgi:death on curing protein